MIKKYNKIGQSLIDQQSNAMASDEKLELSDRLISYGIIDLIARFV